MEYFYYLFPLQPDDVKGARELLQLCSRYYHNGDLYPDCMYARR